MATDATGAPTTLGIPKIDPDADAPSGLGTNAGFDATDALLAARVTKPAGLTTGDVPVWNGSTWVRPAGTADGHKLLDGSGNWVQALRGSVQSTGTINSGSGFTITHGGTGLYTINFSTSFAATPAVVVTLASTIGYVAVTAASTSSASLSTFNTATVATDLPFHFIAMNGA